MLFRLRRSKRDVFMREGVRKYLSYAFGEVLLVVVGILLALQNNNWNENRKEQATVQSYLKGIARNMREDLGAIELLRARRVESLWDWTGSELRATSLAAEGVAFGTSAALPGLFSQQVFDVSDALQFSLSRLRFKGGVQVTVTNFEKDYRYGSEGIFNFGSVDAFGRGIGRYWELKKRLDPGSTNEAIERLLRPVERYLTGKVVPGAGGGGFVLMLARDAEAAQHVRTLLRKNPPNRMARFFDFDVDHKGLAVTVL